MREIEYGFELSNGRIFYANNGIIGMSPRLDRITEGYDGGISYHFSGFTKEELIEISDFMIQLWGEYKIKVQSHFEKGVE